LKELGGQRTAMITCMTCASTARRWKTWEEDPRQALGREVEWETSFRNNKHGTALRDELLAFEVLIANHREEFNQIKSNIVSRGDWLNKKAKLERKNK
jgi:hypothetical protein